MDAIIHTDNGIEALGFNVFWKNGELVSQGFIILNAEHTVGWKKRLDSADLQDFEYVDEYNNYYVKNGPNYWGVSSELEVDPLT